ncbi:MAG: hypothetical protein FJ031_13855 [Chloroflexi bacterium]|nr:hypothetical protein [Chloroflexota bacterium]
MKKFYRRETYEYHPRIEHRTEHEKWDEFITNSPQGTLFHKLEWNQMLVETDPKIEGFLPLVYMVKKDNILAAMIVPYHHTAKTCISEYPFFGYVSPLLAEETNYTNPHHKHGVYSILVELTRKMLERIPRIRLDNPPDMWDIRALTHNSWEVQPKYTHILHAKDDVWQKISPDLQAVIRHGQDTYQLQTESNANWDEEFASLNPQIDSVILKKRLNWMRSTSTGRLFTLTNSHGQVVAFTLAMFSQPDGRAYLWGTSCKGKRSESEILPTLLWEVCSTIKNDHSRIDLGDSNNFQISHIKDNLGAKLTPRFVTRYRNN